MRFGRTRRWVKVWGMLLASCAGCAVALAGIPDEEQAKLQAKVAAELDKAVTALIDECRLAGQLFLAYPVAAPTRTKDDIKAEVDKAVAAAAQAKFAELNEDYYKVMAAERYPVFAAYQTVTVVKNDGTAVHDILREIAADGIRIGNQVIKFPELSEQSLVNFDAKLAAQRRAAFVRQKMQSMDQERKLYEHVLRDDIEKKFYEGAGYLLVRGEWTPATDYLAALVRTTRNAYRERLQEAMTNKVYSEAGYVWHDGAWLRPAERAQLTAPPPEEVVAPAPVETPAEVPKEAPKESPSDNLFK